MQIQFEALTKQVVSKALVSGDKSFSVLFQGEDIEMAKLVAMPADALVKVTVEIAEQTE